MKKVSIVTTTLLTLIVVTGCAGSVDEAEPKATAEAFYHSIDNGAFESACGLLLGEVREKLEESKSTSCAEALAGLGISGSEGSRSANEPDSRTAKVYAYGRKAMVQMDGDAAFLARQSTGWLVIAAGCKERSGKPYDCELEVS